MDISNVYSFIFACGRPLSYPFLLNVSIVSVKQLFQSYKVWRDNITFRLNLAALVLFTALNFTIGFVIFEEQL